MSRPALTVHPLLFAWPALLALLVICVASAIMFRLLVMRWTTRKGWLDLSRWADECGMTLYAAEDATVPEPLATLTQPPPIPAAVFTGDAKSAPGTTIVSMRTPRAQRTDPSQYAEWHVLVRAIEANWPTTGLRPRANPSSLLDLFPQISSFPSMAPPDRFVIFGSDSAAARRVARSSLLALLPPDLGLLLHGPYLLLDFSARPFDSIELTRISTLVDQLVEHLPDDQST